MEYKLKNIYKKDKSRFILGSTEYNYLYLYENNNLNYISTNYSIYEVSNFNHIRVLEDNNLNPNDYKVYSYINTSIFRSIVDNFKLTFYNGDPDIQFDIVDYTDGGSHVSDWDMSTGNYMLLSPHNIIVDPNTASVLIPKSLTSIRRIMIRYKSVEELDLTEYVCSVKSNELNSTTNNSFDSSVNKFYMTTLYCYNESNKLVTISKLSRALEVDLSKPLNIKFEI